MRDTVAGLAALLGFELLPRIRNWHDLTFYRPDPAAKYEHINALFGDDVIDWDLIEKHWPDLVDRRHAHPEDADDRTPTA